eukprot:comp22311_c0_seq1/m.53458 comp22311_c0_seq1/g.53458  ORF comp22311_c0_seq1/g.53458 comp22311_c0_seq1/m.53458 type:complete len:505 (+) comp22311_c0_seq1:37-1551(+)
MSDIPVVAHQSQEYTDRLQSKAESHMKLDHFHLKENQMDVKLHDLPGRDVLIMVVNERERAAVLGSLQPIDGKYIKCIKDSMMIHMGQLGGAKVAVVQSDPSAHGTAGSHSIASLALKALKPRVLVSLGVAFGIPAHVSRNPKENEKLHMGDVVISEAIFPYEHARISEDGSQTFRQRPIEMPRQLMRLVHDSINDITRQSYLEAHIPSEDFIVPDRFNVHIGSYLSGSKLADNVEWVKKMAGDASNSSHFEKLLAGEMEGGGIADAMSLRDGVPFLVVKGICDWGHGKSKHTQEAAAFHAVKVLEALIPNIKTLDQGISKLAIDGYSIPAEVRARDELFGDLRDLCKFYNELDAEENKAAAKYDEEINKVKNELKRLEGQKADAVAAEKQKYDQKALEVSQKWKLATDTVHLYNEDGKHVWTVKKSKGPKAPPSHKMIQKHVDDDSYLRLTQELESKRPVQFKFTDPNQPPRPKKAMKRKRDQYSDEEGNSSSSDDDAIKAED